MLVSQIAVRPRLDVNHLTPRACALFQALLSLLGRRAGRSMVKDCDVSRAGRGVTSQAGVSEQAILQPRFVESRAVHDAQTTSAGGDARDNRIVVPCGGLMPGPLGPIRGETAGPAR